MTKQNNSPHIALRLSLIPLALVGLCMSTATPAVAAPRTSSNNLVVGRLEMWSTATSCDWYTSNGCSWSSRVDVSPARTFNHKTEVRGIGVKIDLTVTKPPSLGVAVDYQELTSANRTLFGTTSSMAGTVKPAVSSSVNFGVGARSTITVGGYSLNSGWTL